MAPSFKGYVLPGPTPPGLPESDYPPDTSLDALSGQFKIFQLKKGHRFSTDDVLAEATSHLRVVWDLLRESRHTEVMALWGRVWQWQAAILFVLFAVTELLLWWPVEAAEAYAALWTAGLAALQVPTWLFRYRDGPPNTPSSLFFCSSMSATLRCGGWSSPWLVNEKATLVRRSKDRTPSGLG